MQADKVDKSNRPSGTLRALRDRRGWLLWQMLTANEQRALSAAFDLAALPRTVDAMEQGNGYDWENSEQVASLMKQIPRGRLGLLLAGAEVN